MSLPEGLGDGATDNNVRCLIYEHLLMDGRGVQLNGPINGPVSFHFNMLPDDTYELKRKREEETKYELFHGPGCYNPAEAECLIPDPIENASGWILKHPKYSKWRSGKHPLRRFLWISGMAGTGKSDIAKSIIRDLSFSDPQHHHCRKPQNRTLVLSYFFQPAHTSSNLAQGLLSQLVQAQPTHDDVFFVINALHECSGDVPELYGRIQALASSNGRHNFNVVLTSRPLTLWDRMQSSCDTIYLGSPDELRAIKSDIEDHVPIVSSLLGEFQDMVLWVNPLSKGIAGILETDIY
ncbi:hypothetical protein V2G26_004676 [Clonostachys chloroleuca]